MSSLNLRLLLPPILTLMHLHALHILDTPDLSHIR